MLKLKYKNLIQNITDTKITPVSIPQKVKEINKTTYAYFWGIYILLCQALFHQAEPALRLREERRSTMAFMII